jgi:hypothetical protein
MTKHSVKKGTAVGWAGSAVTKNDLSKVRRVGFLPTIAEVMIPDDKVVPRSDDGYRVLFLSFLYCGGISLPAHKFLRGLLFVYGMQLRMRYG